MDEVTRYRIKQKSKSLQYLWIPMIVLAIVLFPLTRWNPICLLIAIILSIAWWLFGSLTVEITDHFLRIAFGPGFVKRKWRLDEIESVESIKNPWWYGIGIHFTAHGWLYNVSLPDGIEVKLKSGSVFRIGTDDPSTLSIAIRAALRDVRVVS